MQIEAGLAIRYNQKRWRSNTPRCLITQRRLCESEKRTCNNRNTEIIEFAKLLEKLTANFSRENPEDYELSLVCSDPKEKLKTYLFWRISGRGVSGRVSENSKS